MKSVFLLWHTNSDTDNEKLIGVYESRDLAQAAIGRVRSQPGFIDYPDGFLIDEYALNEDNWVEGFGIG